MTKSLSRDSKTKASKKTQRPLPVSRKSMGSKVVSLARKAGRLAVRSFSGGIASAVKATRSTGKPAVSKTTQATGSAPAPVLVARASTRADEASRAVLIDNIPVIPRVASREELRASYDAESTLSLYMRHVGEVPLLTPEQEIVLAARIKQGDESAREHMIRANLRLVVKISREYDNLGLPLLDLINEGNIGLMKAVERFDPAKGGKLSTYGSWWIKQSIRRALANQSKTIRLPVHVVDKLCKIRRVATRLQEELGREPSDSELGHEMGIPAWRVAEMRQASVRPASLDAPMGDDDTSRLSDIVEDENSVDPYEQLEGKTVTHMMLDFVETLPSREATILRLRFGLNGERERTLEEVGQMFGVTRERIRQLQNIALAKVRRLIDKMDGVQQAA